MPTSIYDSRVFVKKLVESGMSEGQADTLASENVLLIAEHLATKDDFEALKSLVAAMVTKDELRAELATLRAEMSTQIASVRTDMGRLRADMGVLRADLGILRADFGVLRTDMGALENRLLIKLGVLMAAMMTVMTAVLGALITLA